MLGPTPSISMRIPTKDSGFWRRSSAGWGIGGLYVEGRAGRYVRTVVAQTLRRWGCCKEERCQWNY